MSDRMHRLHRVSPPPRLTPPRPKAADVDKEERAGEGAQRDGHGSRGGRKPIVAAADRYPAAHTAVGDVTFIASLLMTSLYAVAGAPSGSRGVRYWHSGVHHLGIGGSGCYGRRSIRPMRKDAYRLLRQRRPRDVPVWREGGWGEPEAAEEALAGAEEGAVATKRGGAYGSLWRLGRRGRGWGRDGCVCVCRAGGQRLGVGVGVAKGRGSWEQSGVTHAFSGVSEERLQQSRAERNAGRSEWNERTRGDMGRCGEMWGDRGRSHACSSHQHGVAPCNDERESTQSVSPKMASRPAPCRRGCITPATGTSRIVRLNGSRPLSFGASSCRERAESNQPPAGKRATGAAEASCVPANTTRTKRVSEGMEGGEGGDAGRRRPPGLHCLRR